jgi:uncharacterized protein YjiS (DUF1127 family)
MRTTITRAAISAAANLLAMRRTRRNAWILHELSDAQLKDIGLTRFDIGHLASGAEKHFVG